MDQSLFSENEMSRFTKPSMLLYVEDTYNVEINTYIQTNFKQIVDTFQAKDIDFCYLPNLLQNEIYKEIVNYNRPYLHQDKYTDSVSNVYSRVKQLLFQPFQGPGLVWIESDKSTFKTAVGFQIIEDKSFFDQFNLLATAIYELNKDEKELWNSDVQPSYKRSYRYPIEENLFSVSKVEEEPEEYVSDVRFMSIETPDADSKFNFEAYRLADEIRVRIQLLKESGSLSLIGDILEDIQGSTKKLSTVYITNDYRIFLKDYNMQEVFIPPLPKSLFILFLRHPEGILFRLLSNYHDELLSIYRNVTVHENIETAMERIKAMTDPLNNSVNEKCSRIRGAFVKVIAEYLAKNYYVTGNRGETKMIILDRTLVEFQ